MSARLAEILAKGGLAVIPTDTVYGIAASARNRSAVARLYTLRRQTPRKPFIILIPHLRALREFGISPTSAERRLLKKFWPGKVTVVLSCSAKRFSYLHLGKKSLAFRVPHSRRLCALLEKTGPLVAPSANPEGKRPAETAREARRYFGAAVDLYVSGRRLSGAPSTVVSFLGAAPKVIRAGAAEIRLRNVALTCRVADTEILR